MSPRAAGPTRSSSRQRKPSSRLSQNETSPVSRTRGNPSNDPYDPDLDLEVEACDDHQFRGDQLYMHIRWTGYSEDEATWEPIEGLTTCAETIAQYLHQLQNRQPKEYTALLGSLPTFIKKLIPKSAPAKTKKAKPTKDVPLQVRDKPTDGHAPAAKAKCTSPVPLLNPDHTPPIPPPTTTRPEEQANQPVMRELLVQSLLEAAPPPPSMPKFTSIPTFQQLQPMMIETITQARRVPSLPPNQWKPAAEAAWRVYLRSVPSLIDTAVKSRDKRLLFNALWDVLTAPSRVIAPHFGEGSGRDDDPVRCAFKKVRIGQESKALKVLQSNGIAAATPEVIRALRDLHPTRTTELHPPTPSAPQLVITDDTIFKLLYQQAEAEHVKRDAFGWSAPLLLPCRAAYGGALVALSKMLALIASDPELFPPPCPQLLSTGCLTPINKLCAVERKLMEEIGASPKVRPINAGTLFAKTLLSCVLSTQEAKEAALRTSPYQLSLRSRRGTERLVHTARSAHEAGWLIGKNDITNGFNTVKRQSLLDAHDRFFPSATRIFNYLYGVDAPVFLFAENGETETLWSQEGARQGCAIGSESFCFAIDGPIRNTHSKYPEFTFKLLTDDIIPMCPPPVNNTPEEWSHTLTRYSEMLSYLRHELSTIGLTFNLDKSAVLIPEGANCADDCVPSLKATRGGVIIAGAPSDLMRSSRNLSRSKLQA